MTCKCGCETNIADPRLVTGVRTIFGMLGHSAPVNSGCRCEKHNKEVGGAAHSYHVKGLAVDLGITDPDEKEETAVLARKLGFGGIGWAKWGIHLDLGPVRPDWRYDAQGKVISGKQDLSTSQL